MHSAPNRHGPRVAAGVAIGVLLAVGLSYWFVRHRRAGIDTVAPQWLAAPPVRPYLLVRSMRTDASFGKLLLVPLAAPDGPAYEAPLRCDRAAMAGTRGVCLSMEGSGTPAHYLDVFDERFARVHRIPLAGVPNRIGLARTRDLAAVSVAEHTHDDPAVDFVPRTIVVDLRTGEVVADLADFRFAGSSAPGPRPPGIWGVTFADDGDRFFATLEAPDAQYLVEGRLSTRSGRTVRRDVESPALSPDGSRIVYKQRVGIADPPTLRLYDLRTGADVALAAEPRSVEDHVEWLDADRILYHLTGPSGADVWVLRVDGTEAPRMLRARAYAPAIVR